MVNHAGDLYTGMGMQTYHLGTLQKGYNPNCVPFGSWFVCPLFSLVKAAIFTNSDMIIENSDFLSGRYDLYGNETMFRSCNRLI